MAQVYSSVAGNIFGMKDVARLRLEAVRFPASWRGPSPVPPGASGASARALGIQGRPLVGTIVKPKIGLDPRSRPRWFTRPWPPGATW